MAILYKLNRYRFLVVPAIVMIGGLGWAFVADPAIKALAAYLNPTQQNSLHWINDVVVISVLSAILAIRIRKQQFELVRSEEEYRRLFEANPNPVWIYNQDTLRFVRVNDAALKKYGYTRQRFLKMTIYDIRPKCAYPALDNFLKKEKQGVVEAGVWQHVNREGEIFDVSITSHTVEWDGCNCRMVMVSDLTELLKKEKKLQLAYQKIKDSNERLLTIAWSNSHKLRKPVCSVIALSNLLADTTLDKEGQEIVHRLKTAATELDNVVLANNAKIAGAEKIA